ncbi:hypothetical protein KYR89_003580 [Salmonella enterica]|nr:hypothetical protein [Salmonella enterica]EIV2877501.1 hypothetical protein [Salmonella enterica]
MRILLSYMVNAGEAPAADFMRALAERLLGAWMGVGLTADLSKSAPEKIDHDGVIPL